jgi:hypothetical protein
MPRPFHLSIVNTFHLDQQVNAPQLSSEEIAEVAVMKKVITNCFMNPDWNEYHTDCVADALLQTFNGLTITAFLDVLHERHSNGITYMGEGVGEENAEREVLTYFWKSINEYTGVVHQADIFRMAEMLTWEEFVEAISVNDMIFHIETKGTRALIPHLERALENPALFTNDKVEIIEAIAACASRP